MTAYTIPYSVPPVSDFTSCLDLICPTVYTVLILDTVIGEDFEENPSSLVQYIVFNRGRSFSIGRGADIEREHGSDSESPHSMQCVILHTPLSKGPTTLRPPPQHCTYSPLVESSIAHTWDVEIGYTILILK